MRNFFDVFGFDNDAELSTMNAFKASDGVARSSVNFIHEHSDQTLVNHRGETSVISPFSSETLPKSSQSAVVEISAQDTFPRLLAVSATPATFGATNAATPLTVGNAESEIQFISGVTSNGTIASISYGSLSGTNPATYDTAYSHVDKWGAAGLGKPGGTVLYNFDAASAWSAIEKAQFVAGLSLWSAEVNIQFVETTNSAVSNFSFVRGNDGSAYWTGGGYLTAIGSTSAGGNSAGNYISLDTSVPGFGPANGSFTAYGGYVWQTIVHEEGHMLGLGHAGPYNGSVNAMTDQQSIYDTRLYTLMSYIEPTDAAKYSANYQITGTNWGTSSTGGYTYGNDPTTPMMLDIIAAQRLYGAATSGPLAGGQTFGFNCNIAGPVKQFFDFTVNTAAVVTLWDSGVNNTLDLSGWTANETVNLTPGTFSSLNGKVNDLGIALGTQINAYVGGAGNDTVTGNDFADTFYGSAGVDVYRGGLGFDVVNYATFSAAIVANVSGGNGTITKSGGKDTLTSVEKIVGGAGNDTFYVDSAERVAGNGGFNTIVETSSGVTFSLGDANHTSIQEIVLAGGTNTIAVAAGDSDFTYLYGGSSTNTMTTGAGGGYLFATGGTNHMFGGGGTNVFVGGVGTSDMHGGSGSNVYYTSASDSLSGAGTFNADILLSSNVTLNLGSSHIQEVVLNGGTNSLDMSGAADFLYLYGGAGTNTMMLGSGGGYEISTGGTNHMYGGVAGTAVFIGGIGTSDMHGGGGNNVFYVGAGDTVTGAGSYNTVIELAQSVHLIGNNNVQQYILNSGTNSLDAASSTQQLFVYGGAGADTIKTGSGNDYLYGGLGANTFQFQAGWGQDTIQDWAAGLGNKIDLTGLASLGVHGVADITQGVVNGADVITSSQTGSNSITLTGYASFLTAGNFLFA